MRGRVPFAEMDHLCAFCLDRTTCGNGDVACLLRASERGESEYTRRRTMGLQKETTKSARFFCLLFRLFGSVRRLAFSGKGRRDGERDWF